MQCNIPHRNLSAFGHAGLIQAFAKGPYVWRRKVAKGDVIIVRYADDVALGFQLKADAMRFLAEFIIV